MIVVVLAVVGLGAGALTGWFSTPHYKEPPAADEARLRARAAEFYRAQRSVDFREMLTFYTPARQLDQQAELAAKLAETEALYRGFDEATIANQQRSAEAVSPDGLQVEIDGGWATTQGQAVLFSGDAEVTQSLEQQFWVLTGGDWWIYEMEIPELGAYGSPPAQWRRPLAKRQQAKAGGTFNPILEPTPDQPTVPASPGEADGG